MTEETLNLSECFLVREDSIRRLPRLVFAASEACRRGRRNLTALPKAIGAQCTACGFLLTGEELLALAEIASANEESTMLQRLRGGQCAREGCKATHYRLQFFDTPEINWSELLTKSRPGEASMPRPESVRPAASVNWAALLKYWRVGAAVGICLLAWMWWQWHTGGTIPFLREPEHFKVTPGNVEESGQ